MSCMRDCACGKIYQTLRARCVRSTTVGGHSKKGTDALVCFPDRLGVLVAFVFSILCPLFRNRHFWGELEGRPDVEW